MDSLALAFTVAHLSGPLQRFVNSAKGGLLRLSLAPIIVARVALCPAVSTLKHSTVARSGLLMLLTSLWPWLLT